MANRALIVLDLKTDDAERALEEFEGKAEETGKKAGENIEGNTNEKIKNVRKAIANLAAGLVFAEKNFGLVSESLKNVDVNLSEVLKRSQDFQETLRRFVGGEAGLDDIKLAAGELLEEMGLLNKKVVTVSDGFADFKEVVGPLDEAALKVAGIGAAVVPVAKNFRNLKTLTTDLTDVFFKSRGLFGIISILSGLSAAASAAALKLGDFENAAGAAASGALKLAAVISGGLAAALTLAILKVSDLAEQAGTKLVGFFQRIADLSNQVSGSTEVFTQTIINFNKATNGAIGRTDEWNALISELSSSLNIAAGDLRNGAREIISVGSQLGLTGDQLRTLTRVSAEFAKIAGKDVFQASTAFARGLSGSTQALVPFGVKLSEASLQQQAFKDGINRSLASLSENEKVQLRFNKILTQFNNVAGIAAVSANSLADADRRLELTTQNLNAEIGKGAAIIENNNIIAAGLNAVLQNVSSTVLQVAGFFGALGARVLQLGGILLGFSLTIFAVIKGFKILQVLLNSNLIISGFAANIPILNKSLNVLISRLAGTRIRITGAASAFVAFKKIGVASLNAVTTTLFGVNAAALTVRGAFIGLAVKIKAAFAFLAPLLAPILVILAKLAAVVGLVVATFKLFQAVFREIEKRTRAFTDAIAVLSNEFGGVSSIIDPVTNAFKSFKDTIVTLANKSIGLLIVAVSKLFEALVFIATKDPFGTLSDQAQVELAIISDRLGKLSDDIGAVGFDISKLPDKVGRAVAGVNEEIRKVDITKLNQLRRELQNVGKTDLEVLRERTARRLDLIRRSFEQELIQRQEFELLKTKILKAAAEQRLAILKRETQQSGDEFKSLEERINGATGRINKIIDNGLVNGITNGLSRVGEALGNSEKGFGNFGAFILDLIGTLAIQIGSAIVSAAIALDALQKAIINIFGGPGAALAAGLGLIIVGGILKGLASSIQGGSVAAGSSVGAVSADSGGNSGTFNEQSFQEPDEEERRPQTAVTVNVQGDILDNGEDTARRIADLLSDSFDSQDLVVRGRA